MVDLLDQPPFAADGVKGHQKLGPRQLLRRDRVPPQTGIEGVELIIQRPERFIDHSPDGPQRMILRHPLLRAHRAEQGVLLYVGTHASPISPHQYHSGSSCRNQGGFQQPAKGDISELG